MSDRVDDITSVVVSSTVMAELLGLTTKQVRNLAEDGVLERTSRGRYLLISARNYITSIRLSKSGTKIQSILDDSNNLNWEKEKAKHEIIKRQINEIRLALAKNQVHKASDVERVMTDMFVKFKARMLALPAMAAPRLAGLGTKEIQAFLRTEITSALNELASYDPADFYPDEYIDVGDDEIMKVVRGGGDGEN